MRLFKSKKEKELQKFLNDVKNATSYTELAELASTIMDDDTRDEREQAVTEAALSIISTSEEAIRLCQDFHLKTGRHLFLRRYLEEKGVDDLVDATVLKQAIVCDNFGGIEAQAALDKAAKPLLKPNGQNMAGIREIFSYLSPETDDGSDLDELVTELAKSYMSQGATLEQVFELLEVTEFPSGDHRIIVEFLNANSGQIKTIEQFKRLEMHHRHPEMFYGDQAREAMGKTLRPLLDFDKELTMEELADYARFMHLLTDSRPREVIAEECNVIYAALKLIKGIDDALVIAEAFSTKPGRFAFIKTYAEAFPIYSLLEVNALTDLIMQLNFGGHQAVEAVVISAQEKGLSISLEDLAEKFETPGRDNLMKLFKGGVPTDAMELLMEMKSRGSMGVIEMGPDGPIGESIPPGLKKILSGLGDL